MRRHLFVAPHPEDETLGCGGTIPRFRHDGDAVYWLIVTGLSETHGFSSARIASREEEIEQVAAAYGMTQTIRLNYPTATLDTVPMGDLVGALAQAVKSVEPTDLYLPYRADAHSDHAAVFDAGTAASKWFRYSSIERIFAYETQSETDFDLSPESPGFRPNVFFDVSDTLEEKIRIAAIFESEFGEHPFPRSFIGIRALAALRGAASGFDAAEAFMLLRARLGREATL